MGTSVSKFARCNAGALSGDVVAVTRFKKYTRMAMTCLVGPARTATALEIAMCKWAANAAGDFLSFKSRCAFRSERGREGRGDGPKLTSQLFSSRSSRALCRTWKRCSSVSMFPFPVGQWLTPRPGFLSVHCVLFLG